MDAMTKQWTKALDDSYAKLPALPKGATDFIVNIAPWLSLIFGVLSILVGVSAFGFLAVLSPFAAVSGAGAYAITGLLSSVVLLVEGVIMVVAFPSLKNRAVKGWNLLFWSLVLSVVSSVLSLNVYGVVQSVVGALIGYYFLYQMKSYYK
ncbi:MAG: hypothetical protein HY344_03365 [Candidatus Levybacteria bacterium]|nr:hypothetical protein [Candidatus Levybacteria bacterium]